jgi:hypothetical protein
MTVYLEGKDEEDSSPKNTEQAEEDIQIKKLDSIGKDFFSKIFKMSYNNVIITDESSIHDFDFEFTGDKIVHRTKYILNRIKKVYGVDVSNIKNLLLKDIFKRIKKHELSKGPMEKNS